MTRFSEEVERRVARARGLGREEHLRAFFTALEPKGCTPVVPEAQRSDLYLNVRAPDRLRGRLCAITAGTARVEFGRGSYAATDRLGLAHLVDLVPSGRKTAIELSSVAAVRVALAVADAMLTGGGIE